MEPATTTAAQPDYAVELNNLLQGHPTGNLTKYFQYVMSREGRDDAPVHIATAMFRDVEYAVGRGVNKGAAKRDAARQVYVNFSVNGVPGPTEGEGA